MVDVAAIGGVCNQGGAHAQAGANQAVVDGRDGQEHGQGRMSWIGSSVGKVKNGNAFLDGLNGLLTDFPEAFLKRFGAIGHGKKNGNRFGSKERLRMVEDERKFGRGDDRGIESKKADMVRPICEPVGPSAEVNGGGHDELFPDRVDRWIGDLSKKLAEILIQKPGPAGKYREGGIVAHRSGGFFGFLDHRQEDDLEFFVAVTEGEHGRGEIGRHGRELCGRGGKGAEA